MKSILNKMTVLSLVLASSAAFAQASSPLTTATGGDLTCRAKAKEIAAQTYSSCVTETRSAQIDQIRKDYQRQLSELKTRYDKELKKMTGKADGKTSAAAESAAMDSDGSTASDSKKNSGGGTSGSGATGATTGDITSADIVTRPSFLALPTKKTTAKTKKTKAAAYKPKATKGIAKSLPTRKETTIQSQPVIPDTANDTPVVTPDAPMSSDDEAAQNEMQLTLVPASEPTSSLMEQ